MKSLERLNSRRKVFMHSDLRQVSTVSVLVKLINLEISKFSCTRRIVDFSTSETCSLFQCS